MANFFDGKIYSTTNLKTLFFINDMIFLFILRRVVTEENAGKQLKSVKKGCDPV
jgi:hypothetical protein